MLACTRAVSNDGKVRLRRWLVAATVMTGAAACASPAMAQNFSLDWYAPQLQIAPITPSGYDHGGNVSIDMRQHPGYDPVGIQVGVLQVHPALTTYVGVNSNPLLAQSNGKADAFGGAIADLTVTADLNSVNIRFIGQDTENAFASSRIRSQNQFNLDGLVGVQVSDKVKLDLEGGAFRYGDNAPFDGIDTLVSALSIATKGFVAARVQYQSGQFSEIVSVDRAHFALEPITFPNGSSAPTYYFDHTVVRGSSQTEFAFTPSIAAFGQVSVYNASYNQPIPGGAPNVDSSTWRVLGGVTFDLAGFARGQVAVGYSRRNFNSATYGDQSGITTLTKIEYFVDRLSQVSLLLIRDFDDGTVNTFAPAKVTTVIASAQREVKTNLIVGVEGRYYNFDFASLNALSPQSNTKSLGGLVNAKYLINQHWSAKAEVGRSHYFSSQPAYANANSEFRARVGVTFAL